MTHAPPSPSGPAGRVFLVGAGPFAPDLITVRGLRCLEQAEVVLYDDLANPALLDHAPPEAERLYVGKRKDKKTLPQADIGALLVDRARQGKRVVRLKGGDPFVLGRGGEEAAVLAAAGVAFEVVPGVSSAVASAAFAGIPLTHGDHADGFEVLSGHQPFREPRLTSVVLMGMSRLGENVARLRMRGHRDDTPAAVVRWGTSARQQTVVATLGTIEAAARAMESPAVLVVGPVVGLRESLAWFEKRPLFGRRVLVTRARHQAAETCRLLEDAGAETVAMPTIAIRPPEDPRALTRAIAALSDVDILVVTSANAVQALGQALTEAGLDARAAAGVRIVAIGPGTAQALGLLGLRPDLVPEDHRAEGILEVLPEAEVQGRHVLLPRAAVARDILPETLRARGARVSLVAAYVTGLPTDEEVKPGLLALERGDVDVLTFTSASTVQNFAALLGDRLRPLCEGKQVCAIGPVTAEACQAAGLRVDVMPARYTLPALVDALIAHFRNR